MKKKSDGEIHFSMSKSGGNTVIINGYGYDSLINALGGMTKVEIIIDTDDKGNNLLRITPSSRGVSVRQKQNANNWAISLSGNTAIVCEKYVHFTYDRILRESFECAVGIMSELVVNLDDRTESCPEKQQLNAREVSDVCTKLLENQQEILSLLKHLCDEL